MGHPNAVDGVAENGDDRGGVPVALIEDGRCILHGKIAVHDAHGGQALPNEGHHITGRKRREANKFEPFYNRSGQLVPLLDVAHEDQQGVESLKGGVSITQGDLQHGQVTRRYVDDDHG